MDTIVLCFCTCYWGPNKVKQSLLVWPATWGLQLIYFARKVELSLKEDYTPLRAQGGKWERALRGEEKLSQNIATYISSIFLHSSLRLAILLWISVDGKRGIMSLVAPSNLAFIRLPVLVLITEAIFRITEILCFHRSAVFIASHLHSLCHRYCLRDISLFIEKKERKKRQLIQS